MTTLHIGQAWPAIALPCTDGTKVDLSQSKGLSVVYAFPRTSPANAPAIEGWDQIPGAKGCTLQSREFASRYQAILEAGAARLFGVSAQGTAFQDEARNRLHLPYHLLSDEKLELARALDLPTFEAGGMVLLSRLTMILRDGHVQHVFFPVSDPEKNAADVLASITRGEGE